ncbi:MAG: gluconate 2-dehydrogenase subunit 3 family protein [Bacteroidia bacterium]|nr:gluconate 2-dehydrogenase subunit 3 family protein [Bacteroidia bacterium]
MKRRDAVKQVAILVGGVLSVPAVAGILQGCEAETGPDWIPEFFSVEQGDLVAEIAERIIPATDTPGAKDALVHRLIDKLLKVHFSPTEQEDFLTGLESLNQAGEKPFLSLSKEEQTSVLIAAEQTARKQQNVSPKPFILLMKELTLLGYFTSEVGASQTLEYLHIPGNFEGCVPMKEGQKAWAV